jgi:hypothetical protein
VAERAVEGGALNNRELAALIGLGVLAAFVLWQPSPGKVIKSFGAVVATLATPKLLVPLVTYAGWLVGGIWVADRVGLWDSGLLESTLLWAIFSGIGLYFSFTKALQQEAFFKSSLRATVGVSAFVELLVSFKSFPLVVELVAQPVVTLLVIW